MDQRTAYVIYRSWGWSQIDAARAAVHGPVPVLESTPEPEAEAEP